MSDEAALANQGRTARLAEVLAQLAARGVKQQDVALELNVPPQYISDLRHNHRKLSEPFARRFAEVYRISAAWLLRGEGPSNLTDLARPSSQTAGVCLLPVLSDPDTGDPRQSPHWDGSVVAVTGAAAAAAERAKFPFVLRIANDAPPGRLAKNDLVLCSQESRDDAAVMIVRVEGKAVLAQTAGEHLFRALMNGALLAGAEPIGCCIGIVWAPL